MLIPEGKFQEDLVQAGPSGYQPPRNPSLGYKLRFSLVYSIITVENMFLGNVKIATEKFPFARNIPILYCLI